MTVDFTSLLPTVIVGVIAWLIRQSFKNFEDKLTTAVDKIEALDSRTDKMERRMSVGEAILKQKGILP